MLAILLHPGIKYSLHADCCMTVGCQAFKRLRKIKRPGGAMINAPGGHGSEMLP